MSRSALEQAFDALEQSLVALKTSGKIGRPGHHEVELELAQLRLKIAALARLLLTEVVLDVERLEKVVAEVKGDQVVESFCRRSSK